MKRLFLCICALAFLLQATAQQIPIKRDKEFYLEKSKNQKTAAWMLLGAGTCMVIGGYLLLDKDLGSFSLSKTDNLDYRFGRTLIVGGVPAVIGSVPLFISSAKNNKQAQAMAGPSLQPMRFGTAGTRLVPGITVQVKF